MRCPVCNSSMRQIGLVKEKDHLLPVPIYECRDCIKKNTEVAFQRMLLNKKWYYFNHSRWNFLKNKESFNPSRREKY